MRSKRIIISGGGTGGHIFPAIAIANTFKERHPEVEILFVGATGRMEMERVPAAGYRIVGLPISGFNRSQMLKNLSVLYKVFKSIRMAKKVIRDFQPDVVVGVGGYASGPTLWAATSLGLPTLIQEQNSYAGITNKLLSKRAKTICVAYDGMERFFPPQKIVLTGNPIRKELTEAIEKKEICYSHFTLQADKPTILIVGGSLGARTINEGILKGIDQLLDEGIQVIWQTGKYYHETIRKQLSERVAHPSLRLLDFISRMDYAYAVADLVISRAGAGAVSELCILQKPTILIPSPNVSEDHQTKNARAIVDKGGAVMLHDHEAEEQLVNTILRLMKQPEQRQSLSSHIGLLAQHDSAERIVEEIEKLMHETRQAK